MILLEGIKDTSKGQGPSTVISKGGYLPYPDFGQSLATAQRAPASPMNEYGAQLLAHTRSLMSHPNARPQGMQGAGDVEGQTRP